MAKYDFKLPDIGEGVVEGEVVTWHVSVGDVVSEDDPIVDVMTDKATVTIPSPTDGTVVSLNGEVGDMVAVGSVLIEFDTDGSAPSIPELEDESEPIEEEAEEEQVEIPAKTEVREVVKSPEVSKPVQMSAPEIPISSSRTVLASPAVRRRAREANIDLASLSGSGPAGRVRHADIDAFVAGGGAVMGAPPVAYSTKRSGVSEVKIVGLRRKISEQMVKSAFSIPHFSYFEEVDITALEELRQHLNSTRPEGAPKLTYLPFIMQALVKLFQGEHGGCNAIFDILYSDDLNDLIVFLFCIISLLLLSLSQSCLYINAPAGPPNTNIYCSTYLLLLLFDIIHFDTSISNI